MVEQGDAAPLLRWAEGPAVSVPQDPALQAGGWVRGGSGGGRVAAEAPRRREPDEPAPPEVLLQPGRLELGDVEEDQVVAVFVVTFDPRSGESRLGMEGWGGRVEGGLHTGFRGRGGGTRCARTRTHTPASLPAWGVPGHGGAVSPDWGRGIPGALFRPLLRPAAALGSAPPGSRSPICSASVREDWFAAAGTLAFVFSVFLLGWKVLLDLERKEPPSLPSTSPPKQFQNDPALPALAPGCSLRRNFPSCLVHFLRRLYFEELT